MRLGKIQRKTLPIIREDFQTRNVILLTLFIFHAIRNTQIPQQIFQTKHDYFPSAALFFIGIQISFPIPSFINLQKNSFFKRVGN